MIRRNSFAALTLVIVALVACGPKEPPRKPILLAVPLICEETIYEGAPDNDARKSQLDKWVGKLQKDPLHPLAKKGLSITYPWKIVPGTEYEVFMLTCSPSPPPS